ncbi:MAG: SMC-Scp complex subunit ScpB [Clostridiales bacterium]|nr:SMC-Scp complex subunit ScpB [Clostridiales bacterium]
MTDEPIFKLPVQEVTAAIEAVLFVSGEGVSFDRLCEILDTDKKTVEEAIKRLMQDYERNPWSGLLIRKVGDSYTMCTKPGMNKVLERMFSPKAKIPLSQASYETLAVIAYNQPVTRAQVESVRGVSSDSIISRLLDRGWICEAGTLDAPGRPTLFSTTDLFLREFGIESVDELPSLELMSYKTIRDLEDSLQAAAGNDDRQITIESMLQSAKDEEEKKESAGTSSEDEGTAE